VVRLGQRAVAAQPGGDEMHQPQHEQDDKHRPYAGSQAAEHDGGQILAEQGRVEQGDVLRRERLAHPDGKGLQQTGHEVHGQHQLQHRQQHRQHEIDADIEPHFAPGNAPGALDALDASLRDVADVHPPPLRIGQNGRRLLSLLADQGAGQLLGSRVVDERRVQLQGGDQGTEAILERPFLLQFGGALDQGAGASPVGGGDRRVRCRRALDYFVAVGGVGLAGLVVDRQDVGRCGGGRVLVAGVTLVERGASLHRGGGRGLLRRGRLAGPPDVAGGAQGQIAQGRIGIGIVDLAQQGQGLGVAAAPQGDDRLLPHRRITATQSLTDGLAHDGLA